MMDELITQIASMMNVSEEYVRAVFDKLSKNTTTMLPSWANTRRLQKHKMLRMRCN